MARPINLFDLESFTHTQVAIKRVLFLKAELENKPQYMGPILPGDTFFDDCEKATELCRLLQWELTLYIESRFAWFKEHKLSNKFHTRYLLGPDKREYYKKYQKEKDPYDIATILTDNAYIRRKLNVPPEQLLLYRGFISDLYIALDSYIINQYTKHKLKKVPRPILQIWESLIIEQPETFAKLVKEKKAADIKAIEAENGN